MLDTILASEFSAPSQLLARIAAGVTTAPCDYAADRLRDALKFYVLDFRYHRTVRHPRRLQRHLPRDHRPRHLRRAPALPGPDADNFHFLRDAITLDLIADSRGYSSTRAWDSRRSLSSSPDRTPRRVAGGHGVYRYHAPTYEVGGDLDCRGQADGRLDHARIPRTG